MPTRLVLYTIKFYKWREPDIVRGIVLGVYNKLKCINAVLATATKILMLNACMSWRCAAAADCFHHLNAGNFSSPGFPISLPVYPVFCEWIIDGPSSHQVQLEFHVVDLPRLTIGRRQASYLSFGDFNLLGQRVEYRRVYGRQQSLVPFISARQSAWVALLSTGDPTQQHQGLLIEVSYLPYGRSHILLFHISYY